MEPYISCIKMRGIPILPPLMTDDYRAEMKYYKTLALAVEKKIEKFKAAKICDIDVHENNIEKFHQSNDYETSNIRCIDQQSNSSTIINIHVGSESSDIKINSESTDGGWKGTSDDDTITKSTDINKFMNSSDSSKNTDITETISDIPNPNIPKTLDIIPITIDNVNIQKIQKSSSEIDESEEEGEEEGEEEEEEKEEEEEEEEEEEGEGDAPKLIRQNSYTLDTPSPMLLAHLEHSKENHASTTVTNGIKGRAWSSLDDKSDWQYERIDKDPIRHYSSENEILSKARRNSISRSNDNSNKGDEHVRKKNEKELVNQDAVKSVDCIPAIFSKQYCHISSKDDNKNSSIKKISSIEIQKNPHKYTSNINLINKFSGSLGALTNQNSHNKSCKLKNDRMSKSFDTSSTSKDEFLHSPNKSQPVIASDKLVHVFEEIQKTHERQMADLMARQQKEQIMMQQEFQKQQLLLLSKIEKTFPGVVSLPLLQKKIITPLTESQFERQKYSPYTFISVSKSRVQNDSRNSTKSSDYIKNRSDSETSPIDGSSLESDESTSFNFNASIQERSLTELNMSCKRKKTNVSRELFPLESNTTHVPVTNGFNYDERHIQAAIKINAYARGYLIRRLMKTERVITLKNTYKEALHCMLKLHVDAPLELSELNFHKRLQHQCDAASISIVELFSQSPAKKMKIIAHDREIKRTRQERSSSARSSYSFATQRTLARKRFKEMGINQMPESSRTLCSARTRCQTWTSNAREKRTPGVQYQGIKRSTSAGAVRKPWR